MKIDRRVLEEMWLEPFNQEEFETFEDYCECMEAEFAWYIKRSSELKRTEK